MDQFTPSVLYDLYILLSLEDKRKFLSLIGPISTAEDPFTLTAGLSVLEQSRFADLTYQALVPRIFPLLHQEARRLIREDPDISDEQLDKDLFERVSELFKQYGRELREKEQAAFKEARDPPKRNVDRDTEIIRLAKEGKTSGEVHLAIKDRWPCSPGAVNQVIIRAKRDGQLPK